MTAPRPRFLQLCLPTLVRTLDLYLTLLKQYVAVSEDLFSLGRGAECMVLCFGSFCLKYSLAGTSQYALKLQKDKLQSDDFGHIV